MMINVRISNNTSRKTLIVDEATTIQQAFEEAGLMASGMLCVNGITVPAVDIDRPINSFNVDFDRTVYISTVAKAENAARCTVLGNAAVIQTELKVEDLKLIDKYYHDALTLYEYDDDEVVPVFRVEAGEIGTINKFGATIPKDSKITVALPEGVMSDEEKKEYIIEAYGSALKNLKKYEESIAETLNEARAAKAIVEEMINVL